MTRRRERGAVKRIAASAVANMFDWETAGRTNGDVLCEVNAVISLSTSLPPYLPVSQTIYSLYQRGRVIMTEKVLPLDLGGTACLFGNLSERLLFARAACVRTYM